MKIPIQLLRFYLAHEILAYGGDFTDRYTDYNFCGNGIVYADRKPSPKMQDVKFLYQTVRIHPDKNGFEIENKNLFTDTSAYIFNYQLLKDGKSIYNSSLTCVCLNLGEEDCLKGRFPRQVMTECIANEQSSKIMQTAANAHALFYHIIASGNQFFFTL